MKIIKVTFLLHGSFTYEKKRIYVYGDHYKVQECKTITIRKLIIKTMNCVIFNEIDYVNKLETSALISSLIYYYYFFH